MGGYDDDDEDEDFMDNVHDDNSLDIFADEKTSEPIEIEEEEEIFPDKNWNFTNSHEKPYLVLARKYRPRLFEDLIGQDAMVRTLTNAISQNRIAHSFMLTGVRGIGKTTTARLIARALNYSSPSHNAPNMDLSILGIHCDAIINGNHPDVIELDAATNTQVEKIRDLLENARYAPIQARYKIYIIDEVHMLSKSSFAALLKTLEEPPPHIKFIFATTDPQNVPITILSRCQRFDLRRIEQEQLTRHLQNICTKENVNIEIDGLKLIARAAEGSVRDSLSLLDQAIVQDIGEANLISADKVRDMLGLSDRNRIYDLVDSIISGDAKKALLEAKEQIDFGAAPFAIVSSAMEILHEIGKLIVLGEDYKNLDGFDNYNRLKALSSSLTQMSCGRLWQMLFNSLDEIRRANDDVAALDMAILRVCGAQKLPSPEDLVKIIQSDTPNNNGNNGVITEKKTEFSPIAFKNFDDVLAAIENNLNDKALVADLELYAMPVRVEKNLIGFEPKKTAPKNLQPRLLKAMEQLTRQSWKVYIEQGGSETIVERRQKEKAEIEKSVRSIPKIMQIIELFPGTKITSIHDIETVDEIGKTANNVTNLGK